MTEDITEGGIYLIRIPCFGCVVRRIKLSRERKFLFFSDNPRYEPLVVDPADQKKQFSVKLSGCYRRYRVNSLERGEKDGNKKSKN